MLVINNINLRRFNIEDVKEVALLCNNINIWNNVKDYFPHPYSIVDAENYINSCLLEKIPLTFAIEYEGKLVGAIGLELQSDVYRLSAELGYWIGEPYWGNGIATESVKLITNYGFTELGLVRIFSGVFEHNIASMKVLEKAGFVKECIAKKAIIKNDKLLDGHRFAMVKVLS